MLARIEAIKKEKKVGIIVHNKANLFTNGITQNAYFIYQCLENIGMKCQFLCHDGEPAKFGFRDLEVKTLSTDRAVFDPSEYHTIISVTRGLLEPHYKMLKEHNVHVISFICGNGLMQHMEEFVKGESMPGVSTGIGLKACADELWLIPSLKFSIDYYKVIKDTSIAHIVPHLWGNTFLSETCAQFDKKPEKELFYNFYNHVNKKLTILIMEPNLSLVKNAWIPIIACEKLNRMYPDLIENVFVFNFPKHDISYSMTDHLSLGKKLRKFKRLSMSQVMLHFNAEKSFPVFLTNQILTSLNYLYYETLYYGWPLVHNSPDLDGCGYFYPEHDIAKCVEAIMNAFNTHNINSCLHIEKNHKYLKRTDPLGEENKKIWTQLIDHGIVSENLQPPTIQIFETV